MNRQPNKQTGGQYSDGWTNDQTKGQIHREKTRQWRLFRKRNTKELNKSL